MMKSHKVNDVVDKYHKGIRIKHTNLWYTSIFCQLVHVPLRTELCFFHSAWHQYVKIQENSYGPHDQNCLLATTQKGVDNNKIFELRAETRTERSLGCQMTIAKKESVARPNRRRGGARNL